MKIFEQAQGVLLLAILFLLPWQTHLLVGVEPFLGAEGDAGLLRVYAVEGLVWLAFVLHPFVRVAERARLPVFLGWVVVLTLLVSTGFSSSILLGFTTWLHIASAFLLFVLLVSETVPVRRAALVFVLGLVIPGVLGVFQAIMGSSPGASWLGLPARDAALAGEAVIESFSLRWLRAAGAFPHPNIFGGYLAVALFACGFVFWQAKRFRVALGAIGLLLFVTLLLTYSRSAWLALVLSAAILCWILFTHHRSALRRVIPFGLAALLVIFFTVSIFSQPFATRFDPTARLEGRSLEERVGGLADWRSIMNQDPARWWRGVGLGHYPLTLTQIDPTRPLYALAPVHNTYLLILAELGVPIALLLLLWIASMDRLNYAALPRIPAAVALAMGNVLLVVGFFDHYLWSSWSGLVLSAFVMAMTVRLSCHSELSSEGTQ
ncbi:O-antigen ligase family protein [Candidatus Uhrbacteria bacterium]|nr:O-antigen ligase family protein [Candidatus Uhrbacteria bacterium]